MTVQINGTSGITTPGITTDTSVANTSSTLTGESLNRIKTYTAKATTSGTFVDFTNIPSWAKKITVLFNSVSTNGTNFVTTQLGTSSGIEATGYNGAASYIASSSAATASTTSGVIWYNQGATVNRNGLLTFVLIPGNTWIYNGVAADSTAANTLLVGGNKTLSGVLDRVRITTTPGVDTFDSGSVNILVEG